MILAPPTSKGTDLEEALYVMIPGANVATEYYTSPMVAVQEQSNLRLWVVVPAFTGELCIPTCSSASRCGIFKHTVDAAIQKAVDQGYTGAADKFFMAGHSLGGTCASYYTQANPETVIANIIYGSYVTDQRVDSWEVPVLTIGAELDGGLGRPGNLLTSIDYSDAASKDNGGLYSDW